MFGAEENYEMDKTSIVQDWPDEESFHMTFRESIEDEDGIMHPTQDILAKIAPGGVGPIPISRVAQAYNWVVRNVMWRIK